MFRVLRAGDDLQAQREQIIQDLRQKIRFLSLDVTIVFDAQYREGESTRSHHNPLEIQFTGKGETADDQIIAELKRVKNPLLHTVVTSDKKLAWLARRRGAKTETVEEFIAWLNKRYKNKLNQKTPPPAQITPLPKKPKESSEDKIPSQSSSAEECFDFYLKQFEKEVQESLPPKKTKPAEPKKRKKKLEQNAPDGLTDMERWLKAFHRSLANDD
jgi:uncharacterized protein